MGFGHNSKKHEPIAEINVTPLVDVMLVLLIIFMVTAPLMMNGISLELPKTKETNSVSPDSSIVILSYSKERKLFIGDKEIKFDNLSNELRVSLDKSDQENVFLRADKEIRYGSVARLMSYLKSKGFSKISLITETERSE